MVKMPEQRKLGFVRICIETYFINLGCKKDIKVIQSFPNPVDIKVLE